MKDSVESFTLDVLSEIKQEMQGVKEIKKGYGGDDRNAMKDMVERKEMDQSSKTDVESGGSRRTA